MTDHTKPTATNIHRRISRPPYRTTEKTPTPQRTMLRQPKS
jgi:hypothetical protein